MLVKIVSPTRVSGQHLAEGSIVTVSDEDGYVLLAARKASRFVAAVPGPNSTLDANEVIQVDAEAVGSGSERWSEADDWTKTAGAGISDNTAKAKV